MIEECLVFRLTYNEDDSTEIACDFEVTLRHLLAKRDDNGASLPS
jgi:hypothetical protein